MTDAPLNGYVTHRQIEAEIRRLDDLREEDRKHRQEAVRAEKERIDAVIAAEARRIDAKLADAAAAMRLDNERVGSTATALSERVENSAKTLKDNVDATAKSNDQRVEATAKALADRLAPLEQARFQAAGRTALLVGISGVVGALIVFLLQFLFKSGVH